MASDQSLSGEQKELVAVGASIGSGCHPCTDHHLKAGAKVGLDGERLLAAVSSAERVAAEAAVRMTDHVRRELGPEVKVPAAASALDDALASFGAALGANDLSTIERHMRAAVELGASRPQLQEAIDVAQNVQQNAIRIHLREAGRLLEASRAPLAASGDEAASGEGCQCGADGVTDAPLLEVPAQTRTGSAETSSGVRRDHA